MHIMPGINLDEYGGPDAFTWTHEYLVNYLTAGKHRIVKRPSLKHAFREVLREDFVPQELKSQAYEDRELDIGYGEVINRPTVTAEMLELLKIRMGGTYLDIGTGSGWVAALIGMAAGAEGKVYSLERVQFLADIARINLSKYPGIDTVKILFRDGSKGMPDFAPFDGIHVSAAFPEVPEEYMMQLKIGGILVIPTTDRTILSIERLSEDEFEESTHEGYIFGEAGSGIA
ncbi:MAG: Protein-L-isoaspartate O-methyltransferase [candidate division WS6 bacterium OLB20]|uniref:Protein-L-isoaspartate O-methyltransferase n=1 Tax=candidate division WS6 bacterium OLB20 TaxID=1617426 RepID=A0A136M0A8_9BACT|nr:MAG: Protein-L-isoaspartate O-methyltransferase [candidate division WS6 bacterium OLB20]